MIAIVSVSVAVLLAGVGSAPPLPSSAADAVATTLVMFGANGSSTVTTKWTAEAPPLPARPPMAYVQVLPATTPLHAHPASEAPASNVVWTGTDMLRTTPTAFWLPTLVTVDEVVVGDPGDERSSCRQ